MDLYETHITGAAAVQASDGTPVEYNAEIESANKEVDGFSVKTKYNNKNGILYPARILLKKEFSESAFDRRKLVCILEPEYEF